MTNDVQHLLKGEVITVDGYTASGKGSLAKRLSKRFKLKFLDTGTLYRATGWLALSRKTDLNDVAALVAVADYLAQPGVFDFRHRGNNEFGIWIDGKEVTGELRTPEVDKTMPFVAPPIPVRKALEGVQKSFVEQWQNVYGVILDGRDTGTKIAPEARLKIFLDATPEIRAQRRCDEYQRKGKEISFDEVLQDLLRRDAGDRPNTIPAPDAHHIDATTLDMEGVEAEALALINRTFNL